MDIQSLTTTERLRLAEELRDSVHEKSHEIVVPPEQMALLEERLAVYRADDDPCDPWDNIRAL